MNLSPEKLKLFERLYVEERASFFEGKPFPQELEDDNFREEYRDWREEAKDKPLMDEAACFAKEIWANKDGHSQGAEGDA